VFHSLKLLTSEPIINTNPPAALVPMVDGANHIFHINIFQPDVQTMLDPKSTAQDALPVEF
jgi:hypothetical protein